MVEGTLNYSQIYKLFRIGQLKFFYVCTMVYFSRNFIKCACIIIEIFVFC
jgi:hypothetical protein